MRDCVRGRDYTGLEKTLGRWTYSLALMWSWFHGARNVKPYKTVCFNFSLLHANYTSMNLLKFYFKKRKGNIVNLQYYVSFRYTTKWFSYTYIYLHIFTFSSIVDYYKIFRVVLCDISRPWLFICLNTVGAYFNSKLLIYPSPLTLFQLKIFILFSIIFCFLKPYPQHMEVPRLVVELEL